MYNAENELFSNFVITTRDSARNEITVLAKLIFPQLTYNELITLVYGEKLTPLILTNMCPFNFFDDAKRIICRTTGENCSECSDCWNQRYNNEPWR